MTKAFVFGHPIAHSRSPLIHGHWLKQYGLDGSYERDRRARRRISRPSCSRFADAGLCRRQRHHPAQGGGLRRRAIGATARPSGSARSTRSGSRTASSAATTPTSLALSPISTSARRRLGAAGGHGAGARRRRRRARGRRRPAASARSSASSSSTAPLAQARGPGARPQARTGSGLEPSPGRTSARRCRDAGLLVNTTSLGMTGQPPLALDLAGARPARRRHRHRLCAR